MIKAFELEAVFKQIPPVSKTRLIHPYLILFYQPQIQSGLSLINFTQVNLDLTNLNVWIGHKGLLYLVIEFNSRELNSIWSIVNSISPRLKLIPPTMN